MKFDPRSSVYTLLVMIASSAIGLLVLGFALILIFSKPGEGRMEISNQTGETIEALTIKVCDFQFSFFEVESGSSFVFEYPVERTTDYQISGTLRSGKKIEKSLGYASRNLQTHSHIVLTKDAIFLK